MNISYCSDLHLEFGTIHLRNIHDSDVLILSGDTFLPALINSTYSSHSSYYSIFKDFFDSISDEFPMTFVIAGNHEYYHGNFFMINDYLDEFFIKYNNIKYFNNEFFEYDGQGFFGGSLWFKTMNPVEQYKIQHSMNDFNLVTFKNNEKMVPRDIIPYHNRFLDNLYCTLNKYQKDIIVFSHHSPSLKSVHPRYDRGDVINLAYCNDLDGFIIEHTDKIPFWIHGHIHAYFDYMIENTNILCNPRGYYKEETISTTFSLKCFDIP